MLFKIVHEEPAPPVPVGSGVAGPRLQEVVSRALAKERDERYPTPPRLADDLARGADGAAATAAGGRPTASRRRGSWRAALEAKVGWRKAVAACGAGRAGTPDRWKRGARCERPAAR